MAQVWDAAKASLQNTAMRPGVYDLIGLCLLSLRGLRAGTTQNLPTFILPGISFRKAISRSLRRSLAISIPLRPATARAYSDLNTQSFLMYYQVDPRYQLILVGAFPNARYSDRSRRRAFGAIWFDYR